MLDWRQYIGPLLALAIAIVLAYVLLSLAREEEPSPAAHSQAITDSKWDAKILELDREALDEAYKAHLILVWTNWLKDGGVPTRHQVGFARARSGYVASMTEIERRERELRQ